MIEKNRFVTVLIAQPAGKTSLVYTAVKLSVVETKPPLIRPVDINGVNDTPSAVSSWRRIVVVAAGVTSARGRVAEMSVYCSGPHV